jgi:hypothetical protein
MRNRAPRGCLAAIVLVIVSATGIHSKNVRRHPPHNLPEQQTNPSENEKPPPSDKRGTLELPLVVRSLAPEKTQQEAADDARERDDKRWNDRATLGIALFTLLILAIQTIVFGRQAIRLRQTIEAMKKIGADQSKDMQGWIAVADKSAEAAKKAADAAIESNKLSRDLSVAENRPWLSVNIIIGPRGLYFNENGANLDLIFIIKNIGKTPAVSANIVGHPSIDIGINERIIALEKICEEERKRRPDARSMGYTVFPDEQITLDFTYPFANKDRLEISIEKEHGFIMPIIIGCVDYLFSFGGPDHHQSRFIYDLDYPIPGGEMRAIQLAEGDKAPNILRLRKWFQAGSFRAD